MSQLTIKDLKVKYDDFTLSIDSMLIKENEFFVLLGKSGSGKSTLLKSISGLTPLQSGTILFNDINTTDLPTNERNIGYVFQQPLLFEHMSVIENLVYPLKIRGVDKTKRNALGMTMLKDLELLGFEHKKVYDLSGGQKQRVALGRSMIYNPAILLMDEPFSALDYNLRKGMQLFLKSFFEKHKTTLVFVTHDIDEAFILADRICVMDNGTVLTVDEPSNLYKYPHSIDVAHILGEENILPFREEYLEAFNLDTKSDHLIINPYHIEKSKTQGIMVHVESIACYKNIINYTFDYQGQKIIAKSPMKLQLEIGERVKITAKKENIRHIKTPST